MKRMILFLIIFWTVLLFLMNKAFGYDISYDDIIEKECHKHSMASMKVHWPYGTNAERCTSIWKSQYRFENTWPSYRAVNNIFWLRRHWIVPFNSVEDCIKFWVNRYYKYDYRKTTKQITSWGCYYNLSGKWVCFKWYTHTKSEQYAYWQFVRKRLIYDLNNL